MGNNMQGIGNSEGTSFVYHKNVLLTYNTLIEIQFNKELSWEDASIEQLEKKMVNTRMICFTFTRDFYVKNKQSFETYKIKINTDPRFLILTHI